MSRRRVFTRDQIKDYRTKVALFVAKIHALEEKARNEPLTVREPHEVLTGTTKILAPVVEEERPTHHIPRIVEKVVRFRLFANPLSFSDQAELREAERRRLAEEEEARNEDEGGNDEG